MELVLNYVIDNVFKNTPVLMALIVALGLILNKKNHNEKKVYNTRISLFFQKK